MDALTCPVSKPAIFLSDSKQEGALAPMANQAFGQGPIVGQRLGLEVAFRIARVFGVPLEEVFQYEIADAETGRVA
jgi:hypothetical protein